MPKLEVFENYAEKYEKWFTDHEPVFQSELTAIRRHFEKLPENIRGIEVGLGTGRFAEALGIMEGIEPSEMMRKRAVKRGIEVMNAKAEHLPYSDLHFDFVLFVTICYLDDVRQALREAYRVLKPGGSVILGMIDGNSPLAMQYEKKRYTSSFYRHARFYTVEYISSQLRKIGFRNFEYQQSLFKDIDEIMEPEDPKEGFGEGSFLAIRARK